MQRLTWIPVVLGLAACPSWADEPPTSSPDTTPPAATPPAATPPAATPPAATPPAATPSEAPSAGQSTGQGTPQSAVQQVAPEDAEAVLGQRVLDQSGKTVGRLIDLLVNAAGQPQAAVIDFGGFMGVGNRKVAVHWSALRFNPADPDHKVVLEMTPDQVKAAPEYRNPDQPAPVVTPATPAATSQ